MDLGCALLLLTCIAALLAGNWFIAHPALVRAHQAGNQEAYRLIARALRQGARLFEIETKKLPAAWRAVNHVREGER